MQKFIISTKASRIPVLINKKVLYTKQLQQKKAALKPVAYSNSVQIRCDLFCNQSESAIAFLVGHMCADGRDAVY